MMAEGHGIGRRPGVPRSFRLWVMGCPHVGTDKQHGRESLAEAIRQSEYGGGPAGGPGFHWDIALILGDFSGNQGSPKDDEGQEVIRQLAATRRHKREDFFCLAGNHDASLPDEPSMSWFKRWVDPTGEFPEVSGVKAAQQPYPVSGTWERYSFQAGNLLFLVMSDRNDGGPRTGRDRWGGYPAGKVTVETFTWWQQMVEQNPDKIIISAHHHMLRSTTVASGPWEGFRRRPDGTWKPHYHGFYPEGGPEGASFLYFRGDQPNAQAFERYLAGHPGSIDLWLGGHTHTNPDDTMGGRSHIERRWGTTFINAAALTRYHGPLSIPMSRRLTFTEGSSEVLVQCYLHTADHAPQGWYPSAERTIQIGKPFQAP